MKFEIIHNGFLLSPDGVDGRVGHPLEESLEEADADEEARAEVRAQRRHHRQRRRRSDPSQEDALAAVQGRLRCRDDAGSGSTKFNRIGLNQWDSYRETHLLAD